MNHPHGLPAGFCDANAGVPPLAEVLEAFVATERAVPGNPASAHGPGRRARGVLEGARRRIAHALGVEPDDVVFTSGGTEAANLAVTGLGDPHLPVLLADVEHPAVLEPATRRGRLDWLVDPSGRAVITAPDRDVGLLCLAHAQSEVGTLQPVAEAAALSHRLGRPLFVDAAQTLGREPLDGVLKVATAVALSPHKCGGLRGHGVLVGRGLAKLLRPLLHGGGQEQGLRPGTQSPALAAANALAIERAVRDTTERRHRMLAGRECFLRLLQSTGARFRLLTPLEQSLANTAMLHFPEFDGRYLLPALDLAGVHASHGSACSSGAPTPPRILRAMGLDEDVARACVRFSFHFDATSEELITIAQRVGGVVSGRQKKI